MNMTQIESKEDEDEEDDDYNGDDLEEIDEYGEDIAIDDMSTWTKFCFVKWLKIISLILRKHEI